MAKHILTVPALQVQESPRVLTAVIQGSWLLEHSTPTWRIKKPIEGFQRMVNESRAQDIASAVLDQRRTFPNAIVLATNAKVVAEPEGGRMALPEDSRFLIVDGQHRLWAQHFSSYDAPYICVIHFGLKEKEMATLFLEINANQKRVPASLRWDLFRLTRPDDDPDEVRTADLVFDLASTRGSSLYQRIDMTGEQPKITLKQASVAPAIKSAVAGRRAPLRELGYDAQYRVISEYVAAMRECNADAWDDGSSPLYGARVFRATMQLMPDIVERAKTPVTNATTATFFKFLKKIKLESLNSEVIKASQGTAGINAIYKTIGEQIL